MSIIERIKETFGIRYEPIPEEFILIEGEYFKHLEEICRKHNEETGEELEVFIPNKQIENVEEISHVELLSKIGHYTHLEKYFGEHSRYELNVYGVELNRRLGGRQQRID